MSRSKNNGRPLIWMVAWTAGHDQPEPAADHAFMEERAKLRHQVIRTDAVHVFDSAGTGDPFDVECGRRPAARVAPDTRMWLEPRCDRRTVVENYHQDIATLMDSIDDGREGGVEERRVAEERDCALTDPGAGHALCHADR